MVTKKCFVCKKVIKVQDRQKWFALSHRKYCSRECYYSTVSARTAKENNPNWKGGPVERTCRVCRSKFLVKKHRLSRPNGGSYCSIKCLNSANSGEKSWNWKGDKVGYNGIHHWIKKYFGKAKRCQNKYCPKKSKVYNWANISGHYLRNIADWLELCAACHKVYDCQKIKFEIKK